MDDVVAAQDQRMMKVSPLSDGQSRIDSLNDDELMEIFRRLPPKQVHCLKCVCKHWFSLISNPNFVFSYLQSRPPCKRTHLVLHIIDSAVDYAGRFILLGDKGSDDESSASALDNVLKRTPLSLDFLPVFQRPGKTLLAFTLEATCNGLSLFKADFNSNHCTIFYICNPITRHWLQLPPTSSRVRNVAGFTCQTSIDSSNGYHILGFTVVLLLVELDVFCPGYSGPESCHIYIRVFSTKVGSWRTYTVHRPVNLKNCMYRRGHLEVINGIFHWAAVRCIVAYDPLNNPYRCEVIKLPGDYRDRPTLDQFEIATSQGKLRLLQRYQNNDAFFLWELVDHSNQTWSLRYKVEVGTDALYNFKTARFYGDKVCLVKIEPGLQSSVALLDLRDASVTKLSKQPDCRYIKHVMPYEIDYSWPTPVPQLERY